MPSPQDLHIWMTGIVGRAMGSGKFEAKDIGPLADAAQETFNRIFGEVLVETKRYDPPPAPRPTAQPAQRGGPQHISQPIQKAMGGNDVPATSEATFARWAAWKSNCYRFGKNTECRTYSKPWSEVTWDEFLSMATQGDKMALRGLEEMASDKVQEGQYEKNSRYRIAHAKCVLGMAEKLRSINDGAGPEDVGDGDETPF